MSRPRVRRTVTGALVLVAWLAGASLSASAAGEPSSAHSLGRAAAAVGCPGTALKGSFTEVPGSRGMGEAEYRLRLANTSSQACTLAGRPSLLLLDGSGDPLPTDVKPWQPSPAAGAVTLWPGGSATATALARVDIPGRGDAEAPGQPCQPTAVRLRVSAAGVTSTLVPVQPATPFCESGTMLFRPLVASEEQEYFRSPSAGIQCELGVNVGSVPAFAYCQTATSRMSIRSVTMTSSGHLKICAGVACLANPPENVHVLAHGHHTTLGPFRCVSLSAGVQCRVASGRGFLIGPSGITRID
ncbi:MAG: DUF4232 domain-containing protein [Solirubrobacteraceae bacterium]